MSTFACTIDCRLYANKLAIRVPDGVNTFCRTNASSNLSWYMAAMSPQELKHAVLNGNCGSPHLQNRIAPLPGVQHFKQSTSEL
eukprot:CAMPEP_0185845756 /NCGR_PEP_ID=MMETSP1354-20130828/1636_1 /TAXON_ID=708628 /ORGANISM="Erythrolobus madagascarensis, Strain CCMP3276" /LENGTH=83 /DNA_ID=CAMNT_0028545793 /DNA_START=726 /DNA_END=977 /DNA_ORIENTATION=+